METKKDIGVSVVIKDFIAKLKSNNPLRVEHRKRTRLDLTPEALDGLLQIICNLSRKDLWKLYFNIKGILS